MLRRFFTADAYLSPWRSKGSRHPGFAVLDLLSSSSRPSSARAICRGLTPPFPARFRSRATWPAKPPGPDSPAPTSRNHGGAPAGRRRPESTDRSRRQARRAPRLGVALAGLVSMDSPRSVPGASDAIGLKTSAATLEEAGWGGLGGRAAARRFPGSGRFRGRRQRSGGTGIGGRGHGHGETALRDAEVWFEVPAPPGGTTAGPVAAPGGDDTPTPPGRVRTASRGRWVVSRRLQPLVRRGSTSDRLN